MSVELSVEKALAMLNSIQWDDNAADLQGDAVPAAVFDADDAGAGAAGRNETEEENEVDEERAPADTDSAGESDAIFRPGVSILPSHLARHVQAATSSTLRQYVDDEGDADFSQINAIVNDLSYFDRIDTTAPSASDLDLWSDGDSPGEASSSSHTTTTTTAPSSSALIAPSRESGVPTAPTALLTSTSGGASLALPVSVWEQWAAGAGAGDPQP